MPESTAFSKRLYQTRLEKGLTQTEIAKLIPMIQPSYSRIESGFQEPNLNQLKRIAEVLNVSLDYLLDVNTEYYNNQVNYEIAEQVKFIYEKYFKDK